MPGGSLAERLAKSDPIGPTNKLDLLLQISRGLLQAHSIGIVHRDIKPSNILLSATQTEAKLADFDISKLIGTIRGSETLGHLFSARYASPEQKASQPVGASSDFYSLALVGIELFAHPGKIPGELSKAPISGVPESFRAATRDLIAASAEAREAIVPEWMRALSEAREDALVTRIPVVVTSRACHALAEQGEIRNATHVRSAITLLDEKLGDRVRIRVESRGGQTYVKLAIRPYLIMCRLSTRAGYVTGLEAIDIQRPLPEIVEREIRGAIASPLRLEFVEATHRLTPSAEIEKCLQDLERQQSKKDRSYAQVRHERGVLDLWKRILEYESELVDKQAGELAYSIEAYHDAQHVLSVKLERAPEAIGIEAGSRITVAGGQGLMPVALGTVRDVGPLELSVDLLPTLEIDSVPANGHVMLDQVERTVAMNRSRYALERIERRKNVNPHLLDHLVPSPTANAAPRSIID
jgi:serine/threonine protein kinase